MVGVKVGIEIHQQLNTKEKLFCGCRAVLREEEPDYTVRRRLKATASEMGHIDGAVLFEFGRGKVFSYQGYRDTTCLVELDEEPPHDLNREAVDISLTVAQLLNMKAVEEIHLMRKIVIDGSNTTGFQRTGKVAFGGWLMDSKKRIRMQSLCLEEDAARRVLEDTLGTAYRLDRLGIPLVEIATAPDITSGEQAGRVALAMGRILQATGRIKRGLGTIRQDLNVSVEGGTRVEIKGVQELSTIAKVVENEGSRQRGLLEIRNELAERGVKKVSSDVHDVTEVFSGTASKVLRRVLDGGGRIKAVILPGFEGLLRWELHPGRRFGTELSDRAKAQAGVGGIFHTDELPAYGITGEDVSRLVAKLSCSRGDCIVIVAAESTVADVALAAVVERASLALKGVPAEVRAANADGTTRFMRPMPGSARMYPETDVPSIVVSEGMIEGIRSRLPELLDVKTERYVREYGLSRDLAELIVDSPHSGTFESLVREDGLSPSFVASTFEYTFKMLRREGFDVEGLDREKTREVLLRVNGGEVGKEAMPDVLRWLASNKGSVDDALGALALRRAGDEGLKKAVKEVVERNIDLVRSQGERALSPLMGDLMKALKGKVDGKVLHDMLKEEISKRMAEQPR
jgi:glutamyl-tRNA(Gln) amidotransferase subunit E